MTSVSTFELVERVALVNQDKGRRRFLEFVIDGLPFGEIINELDRIHVTRLWLEAIDTIPILVPRESRLTVLGFVERDIPAFYCEAPAQFSDNRIALSVCEICAGLDCGAITARLTLTDTHVVWDQFGYQNDYEPDIWPLDALPELTEIRFDRAQYEAAFRDALAHVRQLAAEIIENS